MFLQKIESENAPKAIGPYSPGVKLGDFVYLSGQIPVNPVDGSVASSIEDQTHQVMKNIQALLAEKGLETRHIVKTTIFMTDLNDFDKMNAVYASYFSEENPYPARSTVQVVALPKGVQIEIECLVIDTLVYESQMNGSCSGCGGDDENCEDGCCCG